MRVVLDANVVVSAVVSRRGPPHHIIAAWKAETFELLVSDAILDEVGRVLRYPHVAKLHGLTEAELVDFVALLREESRLVTPVERLGVSPDESDNRYLECAIAGGADYLVTGDKRHLLPIGEYEGVRLLAPAAFLAILLGSQ